MAWKLEHQSVDASQQFTISAKFESHLFDFNEYFQRSLRIVCSAGMAMVLFNALVLLKFTSIWVARLIPSRHNTFAIILIANLLPFYILLVGDPNKINKLSHIAKWDKVIGWMSRLSRLFWNRSFQSISQRYLLWCHFTKFRLFMNQFEF